MGFKVRDLTPSDWDWVQPKILIVLSLDTRGLVAVDDEGERAAVAIFDNWTTNSVRMHQVITKPMVIRHGWYELLGRYVYDEGGRKIIYGAVPSDNARAMRLNEHLGAVVVARLKDAMSDGVDLVVFEMRREDCRYWSGNQLKKAS